MSFVTKHLLWLAPWQLYLNQTVMSALSMTAPDRQEKALNDYCSSDWKQKFSRVDDAASLMTPGCFFAKVDLKSAYRSVSISNASQKVTGLKWNVIGSNVYLKDTRLCFGAKLSPGIFHCLTQAVRRMMGRRGYDLLIVYLDDFLIIADSQEICAAALNCLIQLLRRLGFAIHWGKVIDPTTCITFLGIELDSVSMSMRLPEDKLMSFRRELQEFIRWIACLKKAASGYCWQAFLGGRWCQRRASLSPSHLRPN